MLCDIGINLLSDLVFSVLVFFFFFLVYLSTKRRKLLKFFGIEKSKKLSIFTSNLIVGKYGASGNDRVRYSYQGTAIPNEESKASTQLQNLFNYFLPSQIGTQGFLSKLLISDIDVNVFPSPVEENLVEQNVTIISLGLPPYNLVSRFIENSLQPSARLDYIPTIPDKINNTKVGKSHENNRVIPSDNSRGTAVPSGFLLTSGSAISASIPEVTNSSVFARGTSASSIPHSEGYDEQPPQPVIRVQDVPPFTDTNIGFIQKIFDRQNRRYIFYVAGLSENSTAGSAYYLANNWADLNKVYGNEVSFCVLLKVSDTNNKISQIILSKTL